MFGVVHFITYVSICSRAIAQAVSRRLPTEAALVWAQVRSCGTYGGQSGTGAGFLRILRFPLPILIPPTAPHYHLSSGAGTIGQLVADVPSGLSLTPPKDTNKKKTKFLFAPTESLIILYNAQALFILQYVSVG
jgi:hypothetical protein